jgi:hypothetical protein
VCLCSEQLRLKHNLAAAAHQANEAQLVGGARTPGGRGRRTSIIEVRFVSNAFLPWFPCV